MKTTHPFWDLPKSLDASLSATASGRNGVGNGLSGFHIQTRTSVRTVAGGVNFALVVRQFLQLLDTRNVGERDNVSNCDLAFRYAN